MSFHQIRKIPDEQAARFHSLRDLNICLMTLGVVEIDSKVLQNFQHCAMMICLISSTVVNTKFKLVDLIKSNHFFVVVE